MTKQTAFSTRFQDLIQLTAEKSGRAEFEIRPFVCDGNPLDSDVFIVGTNPASTVSWANFWDQGSDRFNKSAWLTTYEAERRASKIAKGKMKFRKLSLRRSRIELFVQTMGSSRVLETNLYNASTPSEKDLRPANQITLIFEFLLNEIRPKAIYFHGDTSINWLRRKFPVNDLSNKVSMPYGEVPVLFSPHLAPRGGGISNHIVFTLAQQLKSLA